MTILKTKLHVPPPRPDWISRPRLIERLDQRLETKLTLVCAPAGFGKTTLVTSWLHRLGDSSPAPRLAWLSLEEDDDNLLRFMAYLTAALRSLDDRVGQTVESLLEGPQPPTANQLVTLLINDLAGLEQAGVLVLDDFHVISSPEVQAAVTFLLEHLPARLHLIVTTREEPNLPLARLRVQRQVTEIRLEDLRFTHAEAGAFLNQTMGLTLSADLVEALESRTEGWIAGLQLAALSLRGRERRPGFQATLQSVSDFGGAHREIIDYLGAEVLRQQPTEVRVFLRQTSILERLSAALCDAVTGQDGSRGFLNQLAQANLFLIPLDDQRRWYRYHSLFADFLRSELAEWEQRALHRRASEWYEAHGFVPEAIKHALAAQDLPAAERLIRGSVEATFSAGGFTTLLGWLNALPEELVRARSDLAADKAWILYLRGELAAAEEYAAAAARTERPEDPPVQRGMLRGFRAYLAINRGDPAQAVRLGQEALALLGDGRSFFRTTALSHLGQAQRLTGDRQAAIQTLRQAVTVGQLLGHHLITLEALGYLTLLLYQQGQLREATLLCQQAAGQHTDERGNPLPMAGLVLIPLGALYFESHDLERAERHLRSGIELCQQMGTLYYTLLGQRTLAMLQHGRGQTEAAWESLAAARQLAGQSESRRRSRTIEAVSAELHLREGQLAAAERALGDLPENPQARSEYENVTVARLLFAQGRFQASRELLLQVEHSAQHQGRHGTLVAIHVQQALTEEALRQHAAALTRVDQALSLAAHSGYRRAFLDEGPSLLSLLAERRAVAPEFVDGLLAGTATPGAAAVPAAPAGGAVSAANQALLEPLSETQMAVLRLVAEGLSNQAIGDELGITLGTTKWHLNQIYGKLGVASRTQAVAHARRVRLL